MKTSKASAALWTNANKRNAAQSGMGPAADAKHAIPSIKALIASINTNPDALGLLAARSQELTPEQRTAALRAGLPPQAPKAHKPKLTKGKLMGVTPAPSRLSRTLAGVGLYGKSGTGARS